MAQYDELFKYLGNYAPDQLASLALNMARVEVGAPLNTEQPTVRTHQSDMTFRVWLPDRGETAILHIEAQTEDSRDKPMHLRMLAYASFLAHQHELNVYSTVFYLRPPAGRNDPGIYSYGDDTIGSLRFTYNVIRVYELDGAAHLNPNAPGLLPFTPLMRPPSGMTNRAWVKTCIETTKAAPVDRPTCGTLLYALSIFGGLMYQSEFFQDRAMEAIMQESSFYNYLVTRSREEGIVQGRQAIIESTMAILEARFPDADINALSPRLEAITDLDRLKALNLNASLATSYDAFQANLK